MMREHYKLLPKVYFKKNVAWSTEYFVSDAGANEKVIKNYMKYQGQRDLGQHLVEL